METIPGTARGDGTTQLDQDARLKLRLPQDRVPLMLKLAGKRLAVNGHTIRLGAPQIFLLNPSPQLYARIVTIKGFTEPEPFLQAVCRQLDELGIKGEPTIGTRRVVKIGNHTIVGFALAIHDLTEEGSILLQERGLGKRRKFGCEFFEPIRTSKNKRVSSVSLIPTKKIGSYRLSASLLSGQDDLQIAFLLNTLRINCKRTKKPAERSHGNST